MATSFTEQEKQVIILNLKESAARFADVVGIRKTTVDQLVEAAEISKGMFYKLYPSKEMLFFEMLEDVHREAYQAADEIMKRNVGENAAERTARALLEACRVMEQSGMMGIMEKDISYLLRRIPDEVTEKHYHSNGVHIRALLIDNGLNPSCGIEIAVDTIRAILLTINHRSEIETNYNAVLQLMIEGACEKMFPE